MASNRPIKLLITGGPGSGATSTGQIIAERLKIKQLDSDTFFHKPTDPPYQIQYSPSERHHLLHQAIDKHENWLLTGSIAAWGIDDIVFSHAVILNPGKDLRLKRLKSRETNRFGHRIQANGDMFTEHIEFMAWAAHYESGDLEGRSLPLERNFITHHCRSQIEITSHDPLELIADRITDYLNS